MKIYCHTDDFIIREMLESDIDIFLDVMTEYGYNEDFDLEDMRVLWKVRNKKGDIQCTVISADNKIIYGFCGILDIKIKKIRIYSNVLKKYSGRGYGEEARKIMNCYMINNLT